MKKILIVEDEESIRGFLKINLKRNGYEVIEVDNGEDGIKIAINEKPAIVILDVMLPGIDGFNVCKRIREEEKNIGIIMLTAKSQDIDKITGLEYGADDYIVKPFNPMELLLRIKAILRRIGDEEEKRTIEQGRFKIDTYAKKVFKSDKEIDLTHNDIVFVTNGSITESSTYGDQNTPAPITNAKGDSWKLWENLAKQDPAFGHPDVFCENLPERSWFVSATATLENKKLAPYFERLTKRSLYDGKVNTGGIITIVDSNWELSFTIHRQPHFKSQNPDQIVVWIYALYSDTEGNYIKKRIVDCTGKEIAEELLYHLGVPESQISELASEENMNTVPVYMPYITSYFMPRRDGDRPDVVPEGSINLAFIGNFAESPTRDTVFTTEYSVRTAMEAVYTLLNVDRGVPEVFDSIYDIRQLLRAMYYMSDKKKLADQDMPLPEKLAVKTGMRKIKKTWVEELLKEANLV